MIPLQLHIKNFLSYANQTQTIDFGSYPLICLSGKNGHGKSALLDAITWAIWGQARKISGTSKPDQGLLHLGQTQMMVSLEFICNGQRYRVKREYMQTYGKPVAHLEFGIMQDTNSWKACTDKTIRGTQEIIEKTLRLTYESFINSAFLRQGQSHEFSTKSPKERKEILASILGLQEYEQMRKYALEKAKKTHHDKQSLELYQENLHQGLVRKPELVEKRHNVGQQLDNLTRQEQEFITQKNLLESSKTKLVNDQQQLSLVRFSMQQMSGQEEQLIKNLHTTREVWRAVQKKGRTCNQQELDLQKKALLNLVAEHQTKLQKSLETKEKILTHKEQLHLLEQIHQEQYQKKILEQQTRLQRLQLTVEMQQQQKKDLTLVIAHKKKEQEFLVKELTTHAQHLTNITPLEEQRQKNLEKQFEKRKSFYHTYRTQGAHISQELELLQQKQSLSIDERNPSCPLCEQNLSASRKKFLQQKFTLQEQFLNHRLKRLSRLVSSLKQLLVAQHAELESLKIKDEEYKKHLQQHQELEKKYKQETQEMSKLHEGLEKIVREEQALEQERKTAEQTLTTLQQEYQQILTTQPSYVTLQQVLEESIAYLASIKYTTQDHDRTVQELKQVELQIAEYNYLQKDLALQDNRKQEIAQICEQLRHIKKEKELLHNQLATFAYIPHEVQRLHKTEQELTTAGEHLRQEREQLLQAKANLDLELQQIATLEKTYSEQQQKMVTLTQEIYDYQTIASATGKDGVQALLIEQALPEIEHEANELLAKLTNNQAHIIIDSLRDLKKGGTKETLDIKISDVAGIRPYELFSGGEAFRIDFALRIAISKLLARRAGTSLQTLIIDEGFGSQDEEGLTHIMDAIYKIQDDFAKVIVVSHLPSMKDNFPVHFYVEKKANGSVVHVIEHD